MWLESIGPRSQCVGGMLLVQWCYKHILNCLTCEVKIDVGHRDNLGVASAGGAALDAEDGAERRLSQGHLNG